MAGQKIRGQETTIHIAVDGVMQTGSLNRVEGFKCTAAKTMDRDELLGETAGDPDMTISGWDFSFTTQECDDKIRALVDTIVERERLSLPRPVINLVVITKYRDPAVPTVTEVLQSCVLMMDERDIPGRTEAVKISWSGMCKTKKKVGSNL